MRLLMPSISQEVKNLFSYYQLELEALVSILPLQMLSFFMIVIGASPSFSFVLGCFDIYLFLILLMLGGIHCRNPQVDLQAQDRAHRIGQKKEVQVFRFCTEV